MSIGLGILAFCYIPSILTSIVPFTYEIVLPAFVLASLIFSPLYSMVILFIRYSIIDDSLDKFKRSEYVNTSVFKSKMGAPELDTIRDARQNVGSTTVDSYVQLQFLSPFDVAIAAHVLGNKIKKLENRRAKESEDRKSVV